MKSILKKIILPIIPVLALLVIVSCDDDEKEAGAFPKPKIELISPAQAFIGDQITITGTGLKNVVKVQVGPLAAANFIASANTDTEIKVTLPQGLEPGDAYVAVYYSSSSENNLGSSDQALITVLFPPEITEITPASAKPTKTITVKGNYLKTATALRIGDVPVKFSQKGGELTATVPDLPPSMIQVTVVTPGGNGSFAFEVLGKSPEITSFSPGEAKPGVEVTVNGIFFDNIQSVQIGNTNAPNFTVVSSTELKFVVPAGATTNKIGVTNNFGTGTSDESFNVIQTIPLPYKIYDDNLNSDWALWGWSNNTTISSTEQKNSGTSSAKVEYTGSWGGFQIHPNNPNPFDIGSVVKVKISIYGGAGTDGKTVGLYIKPKAGGSPPSKTLTIVGGVWTTYEVSLSDLGNPEDIDELVVQNHDNGSITIYLDDLQLL